MRFGWLQRLEEGLIALLLAAMTVVTFSQVIARYVFNYSFVWALELVTYLFAWLIFLGMAYGVRVGSHIGVDAVVKKLTPPVARAFAAIASALCMVYATIVFVGAWTYVGKMKEIGILAQDLPIEQWIPRLVLPFGFALLFVRFAEIFYRAVTGRQARLLGDEAEEALKLRAEINADAAGNDAAEDRR